MNKKLVIIQMLNRQEHMDADGVSFSSRAELLFSSKSSGLGFCGCGLPEETLKAVHSYLSALDWGWQDWEERFPKLQSHSGLSKDFWNFIAYFCDSKELTEHGGSVGGAWLSDRGRDWLRIMNEELAIAGGWDKIKI